MQFPYYYCTINQYLSKLQSKINQPSFSLSEFLFFLRCLPLNLLLDKTPHKQYNQKYYLIMDDHQVPIFRVYLSQPSIEVIILDVPKVPIQIQVQNLCYSQVSHLYRKISLENFSVNIFRIELSLNLYIC